MTFVVAYILIWLTLKKKAFPLNMHSEYYFPRSTSYVLCLFFMFISYCIYLYVYVYVCIYTQ